MIDENARLVARVIIKAQNDPKKYPPLSILRVRCGSRGDSRDHWLHPITWEDDVIGQVRLQRRTH